MPPPHSSPGRAPIGANLARLRRNQALTQESLAEKAGVSVDLIKKLEQGQRHTARLATLENLAEALTVSVSELTRTTTPSEPEVRQSSKPGRISATMDTVNAEDLAEIRRVVNNLVALDTAHGSTGLDTVATRAFTDARTRLAAARCSEDLAVELADAVAELSRAATLLDEGIRDDDPPCAWWVNPAEVTIHHALAASAVGEHRLAVDLAYREVAKLDSRQRRDAVTYRVALLSVAANAHAWSDVTEIASPLVATLPMAGSARGVNVVRTVATNLPSDAPNTATDPIHAMLTAVGDTLSS